jgi:tetratricopeptide (TPR) repeat protein
MSLAAFDKAMQVDPRVVGAHFYRRKAQILLTLQRYEEGLFAYNEAIRSNPSLLHLYAEKASLLLSLQRYLEALGLYEQVTCLEPENVQYYRMKPYLSQCRSIADIMQICRCNQAATIIFIERFTNLTRSLNHALNMEPTIA